MKWKKKNAVESINIRIDQAEEKIGALADRNFDILSVENEERSMTELKKPMCYVGPLNEIICEQLEFQNENRGRRAQKII